MKQRKRIIGDPRRNYAREWKAWRKARGWTQKELAQTLGLTPRTVLNIENGHFRPNLTSRTLMYELQQRHKQA